MNRREFIKAGVLLTPLVMPTLQAQAFSPAIGFAFNSPQMKQLTNESRQVTQLNTPIFEDWWRQQYLQYPEQRAGLQGTTLDLMLETYGQRIQKEQNLERRTLLEVDLATRLHRMVKNLIPRFSLERGFEFSNTVLNQERQCLSQSTLLAAMLVQAHVSAGLVMVWRNQKGVVSNLGHVVTLVQLSNQKAGLLDASDPVPFMRHQGILGWETTAQDYRFMEVNYDNNDFIVGYRRVLDNTFTRTNQLQPLGLTYVRSQFYFYRGERVPSGFMGTSATTDGLDASARFLEMAQQLEPRNALAVYVLGHVYRRLGKSKQATTQYLKAHQLYQRFGFVPQGMVDAFNRWGKA